MIRRYIVPLLLLTLFIMASYWLWKNVEFYEKWVDMGPSQEVKNNPYIAAEEFLWTLGHDAVSYEHFEDISYLDKYDWLFLPSSYLIKTPSQLQRVVEWVGEGGTLVVGASQVGSQQNDLLLEFLGVELDELSYVSNYYHYPDYVTTEALEASVPPEEIARLDWYSEPRTLSLQFNPNYRLTINPTANTQSTRWPLQLDREVSSDILLHWLGFELGRGRFEVFSDSKLWEYSRIDKFDHAHVLHLLTRSSPRVAFVYGVKIGAWPSLIWDFSSNAILLIALSVLAWIVMKARRFLPALDTVKPINRSLREHLLASSKYLWRYRQTEGLMFNVRQDLEKKIGSSFFSL